MTNASGRYGATLRARAAWLIAGLCLAAASASADFYLGINDWDPGPHGWTNQLTVGLDTPAAGGNDDGWLRITFPDNSELDPFKTFDLITTDATNLFTGNWTEEMQVEFDFWASNGLPNSVQVRWQSSTNSYTWAYTLDSPSALDEWTHYAAPFTDYNDWQDPFGPGEAQYLADLESIEWIGIYIERGLTDIETYGIDNFKLVIPEPAECLMLAAALMTSAMSLRRRRRRRGGDEDGTEVA